MTHEPLSAADVERMAELHVASVEDSIPTMLGAGYAKAFFRYLAGSGREVVLTAREGGRIESVLVLSFEPGTVYGRTLRATWLQLLASAGRAVVLSSVFRRFVVRFVGDLARGTAGQAHTPEITYAFTRESLRSTGMGSKLVARADALLRALDVTSYYVRTIDAPTNRALAFYERNGFDRIERQIEGGRAFAVLRKEL